MNSFALSVSPLIVMMFAASITPGPNNLMLMLAGTRYGFLQTIPHLIGITVGTAAIICLTFAGLGTLLAGHRLLVDGMSILSAAYLLWMAGRLLRAGAPAPLPGDYHSATTRPMRFADAVLFQFVNPKVWTMALAASSIAARFPFAPAVTLVVIAAVTVVVNSPCIALWAAFGKIMRTHLQNPRTRKIFDWFMSTLVAGTAAWIVWPVATRLIAD